MLDFLLEILGWSAAIVLIPSLWHQIYKNYKRKSCEGLSLLTFSALFYGMAGLLVANLLSPTLVIWNVINFSNGAISSLIILIQMRRYKKAEKKIEKIGGKMNTQEYIEMTEKHLAQTYKPLSIVLSRGRGVWAWDIEGKKYLDMLSCYSALNLGHCHPRIVTASITQIIKLANTSRAFYNDQIGPFCQEVAELCQMQKVLPMNTGVEAVERAIKAARKWAYRVKGVPRHKAEIIVCENCFHGRTLAVTGLFSEPLYKEDFGPFMPGFRIIPFGNIKALRKAINKNTAAFLVEPIQAEAGIIVPPDGFLAEAKKVCQENNVLFILDEIQTGLGRCGKLFAYQYEDAKPDLLILGKSFGGGVEDVSAVAGSGEVLGIFRPGEDGSTFSGSPLKCAVAREALKVMQEEGLSDRAFTLGNYFMERLREIRSPRIKEIRGKGLLVGMELKPEAGGARRFCEALAKEGLLCKETHEHVIRFAPPLIIEKEELDWALERIEKVLRAE